MLQLLIAGDENYVNFKLTTEVKSCEFFDDLVFQYENKIIFIQAKHSKSNTAQINPSYLFTKSDNKNFNLLKYFYSYETIKKKFSDTADLKFIITTNKDFKFVEPKSSLKLVYKFDNLIIFLKKIQCDDIKLIIKYGGDLYKIDSSCDIGSRKRVKST